MKIAVLASGRGSNLRVILEQSQAGRLKARVCLALSNNPEAGALKHAAEFGVPTWAHRPSEFAGTEPKPSGPAQSSRAAFDAAMLAAIKESGAQAVVLAGYMRLLTPEFLRGAPGPVLNIHPSLLPSFIGLHGGKDAVDYSVRISGCTVHLVTEELDGGPIIIQAACPLQAGESEEELMGRIHALEHRIYPQALQWLAEGRLVAEGRAVRLLPAPDKLAIPAPVPDFAHLISPALEDF